MKKRAERITAVVAAVVMIILACVPAYARKGTYEDYIDTVLDTFSKNNESSTSAQQQQVNGAYRMTQLLEVLGYELDKNDLSALYIADIMEAFADNDEECESAAQQLVNGLYRSVELLELICYEADQDAKYDDYVASVMDSYIQNDKASTSAATAVHRAVMDRMGFFALRAGSVRGRSSSG